MLMDAGMQKVLFGEPPCEETEATSAVFYSITSTQVLLYFLFVYNKKVPWMDIHSLEAKDLFLFLFSNEIFVPKEWM
jgi:hypothetical protein